MIVNFWKYKKYIIINAVNDLRHRYTGSAMGIFWNVLMPLAQILVFTLVFAKIMKFRIANMPSAGGFAMYLCSGLLPWHAFAECISGGASAFIANAQYLKKLPIPEQIFVSQSAVSATFRILIAMILLLIVNILIVKTIPITWFAVPFIIVLFQGFGFGIGLALSCLNVFLRDIGQMISIFLQIWMWLTPIVYLKEILPDTFANLMILNPAYPYIDALHLTIIYGKWPELWHWNAMLIYAMIMPFLGYLILRKLRPEIRDVI